MLPIRIKPELLKTLESFQSTEFTVAQLTKAYQKESDCPHRNKNKAARQYVYRNMLRMIEAGVMEKLPSKDGWPKYRISQSLIFKHDASKNNSNEQAIEITRKKASTILKERLSQHRSDMLCSIGEAEEYNELCNVHPELRHEAQSLYNEARERSATLLGRVKALENLLSHHVSA